MLNLKEQKSKHAERHVSCGDRKQPIDNSLVLIRKFPAAASGVLLYVGNFGGFRDGEHGWMLG